MNQLVRFSLLTLGIATTLVACPSDPSPPKIPPTTELPKIETKVAAATRVIPKNAALQSFTVLNADTCLKPQVTNAERPKCLARFVFPTGDATLATLSVGSVMVSEPSAKAPNGFLFRATAIKPQGANTEVLATEATFGDAFDQGEAEFNVKLRPDQVRSATARVPGLRFSNGASQYNAEVNAQGVRVRPLAAIGFTFDDVVYDDDGNTSTTNDQVRASGSFNFETGDGISAGLKWKEVLGVPIYPNGVYFQVAYGIKSSASVKLTMDITKEVNKEIELATYNFEPITVFVGFVPLVFIPQVTISLNAEGKLAAKTTFSANATVNAYGCLEYDDGFKNCSSFGQDFNAGLGGVNASVNAKATLNVQGNILLYGIVGPYVKAGAYLNLEAVVPRNPVWTLSAGAKASLGLHINLGVETLDYDLEFFNKSFGQIAASENTAPIITAITPKADLLQNQSAPICVSRSDLEEGGIAVTVTTANQGSFTIPKGTDCTAPIKWSTEGSQTIIATSSDSEGKAAAAKSATFNVINAPPDVFFSLPTENQKVYVDVPIPLLAGWIDGNEALDCSKISWKVEGGTTKQNVFPATPTNACGSFSVTVSSIGSHKITLTVKDSGKKETIQERVVIAEPKPDGNIAPVPHITSPVPIAVPGGFQSPTFGCGGGSEVLGGYVIDNDSPSVTVKWTVTNLKDNKVWYTVTDVVSTNASAATDLPDHTFDYPAPGTGVTTFRIRLEVTDGQPSGTKPPLQRPQFQDQLVTGQCIK
jgi:hypothetical protein